KIIYEFYLRYKSIRDSSSYKEHNRRTMEVEDLREMKIKLALERNHERNARDTYDRFIKVLKKLEKRSPEIYEQFTGRLEEFDTAVQNYKDNHSPIKEIKELLPDLYKDM